LRFAVPEMVRSISRERLVVRWRAVSAGVLTEIARRAHLLTRVA
jgi:hypothetical protein